MKLLPLKEVSATMKVSLITLRRYIKDGRLKASKVGREYFVSEDDLASFLEKPKLLGEANSLMARGLNDTTELESHVSRKELFQQARDIYHRFGEARLAQEANFDSNIFGFSLTTPFRNEAQNKKWGRFGPMGSGVDKEGKEHHFPDPNWIDEQMLDHARKRISEVKNPLVLSIYEDLIFTHSKEKDKRAQAKRTIETYLEAAKIQYENDWMFEFLDSLLRSLEIANYVKDEKTRTEVILEMFDYIKQIVSQNKQRYCLEILDALLEHFDLLSQKEVDLVIEAARTAADFFGGKGGDNRHLQRSFLEVIEHTYKVTKNKKKELETQLEQVDSYKMEGQEKSGSGLVAAYFYEKALELVRKLNDPRKEQQELKTAIEQANYKSIDEMKTVSVEFKITEKEKNDFIASVFVEDNVESLKRIGGLPNLIPSFKGARELTTKLAKDYPLQHIFDMSLIQQGRKIHTSSGGLEITEDHVVEQYSRNIRTYVLFSKFLFGELKKRGIMGKQIADFLRDKEVFQYDNFGAIEEGLQNYDEGKYYSALAVMLPQIEEALRNFLRKAHLPTLTIGKTGDQVVIGVRDILESPLLKSLPEDLYWYLRLILWDKRGPALRDNVCHGLLSYKSGEYECYYVLHVLLILSGLQQSQNNPKDTN